MPSGPRRPKVAGYWLIEIGSDMSASQDDARLSSTSSH